MPPFLTLVVGQSLKYRLLDKAGQRYQAKAAYDEAMQDWRALVASIEDQSGWIATWANVLWDAWCHGKRRDLVAEITLDERRAIVLREMQADRWFEREFSGIQVNSKVNSGDPGVSAKQRVVDYLRAHPEIADQLADGEMQQSEVAHSLGVSQASVSRGLTAFSRNGHSEN
jgi:Trp operon repressor